MDIEHLTKSQIVMLTLLVSFVTSIATGIVTVSLMDQAPPVVAQTVNRVIEHTVQTIVSTSTPKGQTAAAVVTQEKTVVVDQSQQIASVVARATPSVVRIYADNEAQSFVALGIVVDASGIVITDYDALQSASSLIIVLSDGTHLRGFISTHDAKTGVATLSLAPSTTKVTWKPGSFLTTRVLLGESLVMLTGKSVSRIASGLVTALPANPDALSLIDTDIPEDSILPGSPITDAQGVFLGISTSISRAISSQAFVPASALMPNPAH